MNSMITERIKALLKKHKKTQLELAVGLGMGDTTVSYNIRHPSIDFVRTVCDWLDEPFAHAVLSDEEIALLSSPDPVIAPIITEVTRIAALPDREKADNYLAAILASARAMK
ncbi:MAG TPA: helix-turn-helix transcriptional regulator [Candidatus Omnitrophota bacterium]|nr:helix-turn-helix transcriptional regulator [Candidatus Omnitrophota bacterium]